MNAIFDGLNLVAKEAPLVNTRDGVVVLSGKRRCMRGDRVMDADDQSFRCRGAGRGASRGAGNAVGRAARPARCDPGPCAGARPGALARVPARRTRSRLGSRFLARGTVHRMSELSHVDETGRYGWSTSAARSPCGGGRSRAREVRMAPETARAPARAAERRRARDGSGGRDHGSEAGGGADPALPSAAAVPCRRGARGRRG